MNSNDLHQITRGEIEHILKCLRFIDAARETLHAKSAENAAIVEELNKSANGIYHVVKQLPRIE